MTDHIVIIPDTQIPYHDTRFTNRIFQLIRDLKPAAVIHVGDLLDAPEPARWSKGMAAEYSGTLQRGLTICSDWLADLRNAAGRNTPIHVKWGNHDERITTYIRKYAPALDGIKALELDSLLHLDKHKIVGHDRIFDIAPGWVCAHGHEGALSRIAGSTAMSLARRVGKSVVCGHVHRAGLQNESTGLNGRIITQLTGMEVGHAMRLKDAHYLKTGAANWQQACGVLTVDGNRVQPHLLLAGKDGGFTFNGRTY